MSFLGDDEDLGSLLKGPAKASSSVKSSGSGGATVQRRPVVAQLDDDEEDFFKEFAIDMDEDDAVPVKPAKPNAAKNKPALADSDDDQDVIPVKKSNANAVLTGSQELSQPTRQGNTELKPGLQLDNGSDVDDCDIKSAAVTMQKPGATGGDSCNRDSHVDQHADPVCHPAAAAAAALSSATRPTVLLNTNTPVSDKVGDAVSALHHDSLVPAISHQLHVNADSPEAPLLEPDGPQLSNADTVAVEPTGADPNTKSPAGTTAPAPALFKQSLQHNSADTDVSCNVSYPTVPEFTTHTVHSKGEIMHTYNVASDVMSTTQLTSGDATLTCNDEQQPLKDTEPEAAPNKYVAAHENMGAETDVAAVHLAVNPSTDTPQSTPSIVQCNNDVQPTASKHHIAAACITMHDVKPASIGADPDETLAFVNVPTVKQAFQAKDNVPPKNLPETFALAKQLPSTLKNIPQANARQPEHMLSTSQQPGSVQSTRQVTNDLLQSKPTRSGGNNSTNANISAKQGNTAVKRNSSEIEAEVDVTRQKTRKISNGSDSSVLTATTTLASEMLKAVLTDKPRNGPPALSFKKPVCSQTTTRGTPLLHNIPANTVSSKHNTSKPAAAAATPEGTSVVTDPVVTHNTHLSVLRTAQQPGKQGSIGSVIPLVSVIAPYSSTCVTDTDCMEVQNTSTGSGQVVTGMTTGRKQSAEQSGNMTAQAVADGTHRSNKDSSGSVKTALISVVTETVKSAMDMSMSTAITTASLQVDDENSERVQQQTAIPASSLNATTGVTRVTSPVAIQALTAAMADMTTYNVMPADQAAFNSMLSPNMNKMMDDNVSINKVDKMVLECQQVMLKLAEMRAATAIMRNRQVRLDNPLLRSRIIKLAADKRRAGINTHDISPNLTTVNGI